MSGAQEAPGLVMGLDDIFMVVQVIKPELQGPDAGEGEVKGLSLA